MDRNQILGMENNCFMWELYYLQSATVIYMGSGQDYEVQMLLWFSHTWNSIFFFLAVADAAKSLQSFPTLCDPIVRHPPGSPVPGILQARTLEWVAFSFSSAWKWKVKVKLLSRVQLITTPWTAAYQAPPSMVFSRQEYWIELTLPSPICTLRKI